MPSEGQAGVAASKPEIHVAVGALLRPDGQVLLGERPVGKPWEGWWELPGGKIEPGETTLQALARELREELGVNVTAAHPWVRYVHEYPKSIVHLDFCRVTAWEGEPHSLEDQRLAWALPVRAGDVGPLLPAAWPPLRWLTLPDRYLVTADGGSAGWADTRARLQAGLAAGIRLVQFRQPAWAAEAEHAPSRADALRSAWQEALALCQAAGAACLINSVHPQAWWAEAGGVHLRARDLPLAQTLRPSPLAEGPSAHIPWLSASVHNEAELAAARRGHVDFAVLGPVLPTASHPGEPGLGWPAFSALWRNAGLPLFAIGGLSSTDLARAQAAGAHGIAGIRTLVAPAS